MTGRDPYHHGLDEFPPITRRARVAVWIATGLGVFCFVVLAADIALMAVTGSLRAADLRAMWPW